MARIRVWLVLLFVTLPTSALGHVYQYAAILSGANHSPANPSFGVGTALAILDLDVQQVTIEASFGGLSGNVTAATIHALTEDPLSGTSMSALQVPTLVNFPLSVTSGSYEQTLNLTMPESFNPDFAAAHGPFLSGALDALYLGLETGKAYFNIATEAYPAGEIRGFLIRVPGDFNHDLVTNAADYTVWRNSLNRIGETLPADTDHDNVITRYDYDFWKEHFGLTVADLFPGGSGVGTVPEPASLVFFSIAVGALLTVGRARR
ncbi:MAG: CHRD domain-containing protein [Pirellulales bacterium]